MERKFYTYDLETYQNCFLFGGKFEDVDEVQMFEISDRKNDRDALMSWLSFLQNSAAYMVGFNSLGFDYPIIHDLLNEPYTFTAKKAYLHAQTIIDSGNYGQPVQGVRASDRILPQIDLVKINHFDNKAKRTSLKSLQFAMRSASVEDLPYDPAIPLNSEQMDKLRSYCAHDITETEKFFKKCKHLVSMRQDLIDNGVVAGDVLNWNDVKIGVEYLVKKIGRNKCFASGSKPIQSMRDVIKFSNIILPKIFFRTEEFQATLDWFQQQQIYITREGRPKLETRLANLDFVFGVGGVHASVENRRYESNATHVIKDIDVSGMYVAVAIANGFAPEHLGKDFVTAYKQLQSDRKQYPKGSTMNAVLKLAGNGVYGNSNQPYSCFYDPKYTFSVTVNGQLQLLQLAEVLSLIPGLELIQANTDGITALVPRAHLAFFDLWKSDWENTTGLKLEEVTYSHMWIADVNNYVAVTTDGKVKRKGRYWWPESEAEYEGWWNKDFSNFASIKGADLVMRFGCTPEEAVRLISNPFDFMLRYKTPGGSKVYIGEKEMLKTVRYYVSIAGQPMRKIAGARGPVGKFKRKNSIDDEYYARISAEVGDAHDERIHTKNKSTYAEVTTSIEKGRKVKECNVAANFNWHDVDYSYYIDEIKKLVITGDKNV